MTDYERILDIVRRWPAEERVSLVRDVTETLSSDQAQLRQPRDTLSKALGLITSAGAPPSDKDIERFLEERRIEKYG